jgi:hypothetical protein
MISVTIAPDTTKPRERAKADRFGSRALRAAYASMIRDSRRPLARATVM